MRRRRLQGVISVCLDLLPYEGKKEMHRDFSHVANVLKTITLWLQSWKLLHLALGGTFGKLCRSSLLII